MGTGINMETITPSRQNLCVACEGQNSLENERKMKRCVQDQISGLRSLSLLSDFVFVSCGQYLFFLNAGSFSFLQLKNHSCHYHECLKYKEFFP